MEEQEIKSYLNYEDVQKELEEAKEIIKELKLALITRDGNLTNKLIHEELTRLRSELQQERELRIQAIEIIEELVSSIEDIHENWITPSMRYWGSQTNDDVEDAVEKANKFLQRLEDENNQLT